MPIFLYGDPRSPFYRPVLLTAKALGVDIVEKAVHLAKSEHKTEAYLKLNPTHTIPTMDDDGLVIWESRAITAYLVQQYGKDDALYPKDPKERAVVDNMLYFDAACLAASITQYYLPVVRLGKTADPTQKAVVLERLGFLDTILGQRPYAAGDRLTIADFSLISTLSAIEASAFDLKGFPNVQIWAARVKKEVPFYDQVTKEGIEGLNDFFSIFKK